MKDQGASRMFSSLFPKVSSAADFMKNVFLFFSTENFPTFSLLLERAEELSFIIPYRLLTFVIRDSRSTHLSVEVPRRGPFLERLDN